ncbi:MAG: hypothetical protein SGARI_005326, partial [Bacillariaceae sp.]
FLGAGRQGMVPEEPDVATLLRRREQLLMQMQMRNQQSAQAELMMRAAAASNVHPGAGGLGSRAAFLMGNQTDLGAGMGSPTISSAFAAQRMGSFPSAGLMGNMSGLMGNSTTSPMMSSFAGQMPMGGIQNPAAMAAASTSNFPPAAMGESSAMSSVAAAAEPAAKRLAPARGVFNKNIKSQDEMIDSLARANARFYKNDDKKSGQRFRGYQCEQWTQKYQELLDFKAENGN